MYRLQSPISLQYLAGLMDGEGCFKLKQQKIRGSICHGHSIILSQSGEDGRELLEKIQSQFGGKLYLHLKPGQHGATKPAYKLYWNKAEGIKLLSSLIGHLILKRSDAELVLAHLTRNKNAETVL